MNAMTQELVGALETAWTFISRTYLELPVGKEGESVQTLKTIETALAKAKADKALQEIAAFGQLQDKNT